MNIERTPLYFGPEERSRFGWLHAPPADAQRDLAVVICAPFGHELINAHRTVRHLADALAAAGLVTLRFDYDGTGDSAGDDEDPSRLAAWLQSIRDAMQTLRELSGRTRIVLAGIRLGATLAATIAAETDIDSLALWAPASRGRGYVREMRALYLTNGHENAAGAGVIEPGGFILTEETQRELGGLKLPAPNPKTRRAEFAATAEMFLPPHDAVVPESTIAEIVRWIAADTVLVPAQRSAAARREQQLPHGVRESLVRFDSGMFGIVSEPPQREHAPTILLPNAGSAHHVGPNRLNVLIARALSRAGFRCVRFDLPGLGDSIATDGAPENDPYLPAASAAIASVMRELGDAAYVLMGLCSGAHASFHAALDVDGAPLAESVIINPLTFYFRRGASLDQPSVRQHLEWQWYQRSMRRRDRWMKLLRGDVSFRRVGRAALDRARLLVMRLVPRRGDGLARDLLRIAASGRKLTFVFARFDPGYDLLMTSAARAVKRLRRQGMVALWQIDDADHTFEAKRARDVMIESLVAHLTQRYRTAAVRAPGAAARRSPPLSS